LQSLYWKLGESPGKDFETKEEAMTTNTHRETAKVYIFPTRPLVRRDTFTGQASPVATLATRRLAANVSFDAWYHDEAIADAARDKGN
jgi:hypothetical protein